jgi:thiol-disulfide isomerase/thioredoxin
VTRRSALLLALTTVVALASAGCADRGPVHFSGTGSGNAGPSSDAARSGGAEATSPGGAQEPSCLPRPGTGHASAGPQRLPDVTLPCLAGTGSVAVARLGSPAVINLWASWCAPCRNELPALQRFAVRAGDRLLVIGVDTDDRRSAGEALVGELGLTVPMLFDDQAVLRKASGRIALPVTLFVDAAGAVIYVYNGQALDVDAMGALTQRHLGIGVPP